MVRRTMREACNSKSADKARKRLRALVPWLARNGYDEAAGSLREEMEETLAVLKLALPDLLIMLHRSIHWRRRDSPLSTAAGTSLVLSVRGGSFLCFSFLGFCANLR